MASQGRAEQRVLVGRVRGAHGVRGLVRIESYMSEPDAIAALPLESGEGKPLTLALEGRARGALLARIEGVTTREAAARLSGAELYVPRSALPEPEDGAIYEADLVGLDVVEGDRMRGKVVAVSDFGAGPLLEVAPLDGRDTVYVPFAHPVVTAVDLEGGTLRVALPAGLWPEP